MADFLGIDGMELILMSVCSLADAPKALRGYFLVESYKSPLVIISDTFADNLFVVAHVGTRAGVEILWSIMEALPFIEIVRLLFLAIYIGIVIARRR